MKYMYCPQCKQQGIPVGGTKCERCEWEKKPTIKEEKTMLRHEKRKRIDISFKNEDLELFEKIEKLAKQNRRSLAQEILFHTEQALRGNNE